VIEVVRALWGAGREGTLDTLAWSAFELAEKERVALRFACSLALQPWAHKASDVAPLEAHGWTAHEIHDLTQVVCCFSYMNRLADGLGVVVDVGRHAWAERLLGADRLAEHVTWGASS
jgi:hypothetical protein